MHSTRGRPRFIPGALVALPLLAAAPASAGVVVENSLAYFNSAITSDAGATSTKLLGSFAFGATVPSAFQVGWNINYSSHATGGDAGTFSLSGMEMGPRFGVFLGKQQWFSLAVSYHPLVNATVTTLAGASEKWSGSGYQFEAGFAPQVGKHLYAGFKLVYDHAGYSSKTDSSSTTSDISYSYNTILPAIYLSWRY